MGQVFREEREGGAGLLEDRPEEDGAHEEDQDRGDAVALLVAPDNAEPDDADDGECVDDGIDPGKVVRGDHYGEQPGGAERHQRESAPRARRFRLGSMADMR